MPNNDELRKVNSLLGKSKSIPVSPYMVNEFVEMMKDVHLAEPMSGMINGGTLVRHFDIHYSRKISTTYGYCHVHKRAFLHNRTE